jgi:hypothetical protein
MTVQTTTDTASEEIGDAPAVISYRGGSERQRRDAMQVWGVTAVVLLIFGSSLAWTSYGDYIETLEQHYRLLESTMSPSGEKA